jgi:fumarylacetoacetase
MTNTTDQKLRSWVESANEKDTDFPIQNLPFGVFRRAGENEAPRVGTAIGDWILDIPAAADKGLCRDEVRPAVEACRAQFMNPLMGLGRVAQAALRQNLSDILSADSREYHNARLDIEACLVPRSGAELFLPAYIGDFTGFHGSQHHASDLGVMLGRKEALAPNYKHTPVAYHGRASTIVTSGRPVLRPMGQIEEGDSGIPEFTSSTRLDFELELGLYIGQGNVMGSSIPIDSAADYMFGFSLVNDWSARDIHLWEGQPLGPFLSKSFTTSVSPWIVTIDALEPFRTAPGSRQRSDPDPPSYLDSRADKKLGGFDIYLEVFLTSQRMREENLPPARLSSVNFKEMYWTFAQMVTHHTSNGCSLRPGDLLASGTVSGGGRDTQGSLLGLVTRRAGPVRLPTEETRMFLEDGDEVILRGYCQGSGKTRIGFGECRSMVIPATEITDNQ